MDPLIKPSRKIVALSIICLALVLSVGIYKLLPHAESNEAILTTTDLGVTLSIDTKEDLTDSDLDGLKDWEEVLWGTNINERDTDSDGTGDGEEVKTNRNPAISAPNDEISNQAQYSSSSAPIYDNVSNNSLTDKISKNLFGLLLQAKEQNKSTLSEDDLAQIAGSVNKDLTTETGDHYAYAAVTSFSDNNLDQGKIFGQKFGKAYLEMLFYISNNKINDSAEIGAEYKELSRKLSILMVPDSLHQTHVDLINNMYKLGETMETLAEADSDPVKAMLAIRDYRNLANDQAILFTTVSNYFKRNGILFDDREVNILWENI